MKIDDPSPLSPLDSIVPQRSPQKKSLSSPSTQIALSSPVKHVEIEGTKTEENLSSPAIQRNSPIPRRVQPTKIESFFQPKQIDVEKESNEAK